MFSWSRDEGDSSRFLYQGAGEISKVTAHGFPNFCGQQVPREANVSAALGVVGFPYRNRWGKCLPPLIKKRLFLGDARFACRYTRENFIEGEV